VDMSRAYCVYILASRSSTLYTGVTGNLEPRMVEHRQRLARGFTTRYKIFRLAHVEFFGDIGAALLERKKSKAGGGKRKFGSSNVTILPGQIWRKESHTNTKCQMRNRKADPSPPFAANSLQPAYRVPAVRDDRLKKWTVRKRRRQEKNSLADAFVQRPGRRPLFFKDSL
jgi:putative endonuclease